MGKTVFVLGAGFSEKAGIPTQNKIMEVIPSQLKARPFYVDVLGLYRELFGVDSKQLHRIPLEDVFTFLDRSISSREDTNRLELRDIWQKQISLKKLISMILNERLKNFVKDKDFNKTREAYESFFLELIKKRMEDQRADPFSIISLNWDTIPEYFIAKISGMQGYDKVKIDYNCYDYRYGNPAHISSIHLKRLGFYNIKIAKLHGSVNWGYCSSCGRLYVRHSKNMPPVFYESDDKVCTEGCSRTKLRRLIITPTFIKDLNNTHLRMIWHNALMDLQEASRIVFVGYSFPLADFEFRCILLKAIAGSKIKKKDKKVRVVLYPPDSQIDKRTTAGKQKIWEKGMQQERFRDFFIQLDNKYESIDAIDFIRDHSLVWDW